jgi:Putative transposase
MVKARVGPQEMRHPSDALWRRYRRGFVASGEKGQGPAGGAGLAYSLATYVVRPPLALRRILRYADQRVCYGSNEHKTGKRAEEDIPALVCIGRLGQHLLPTGLHRIRSDGLHATGKAKKIGCDRAIPNPNRVIKSFSYKIKCLLKNVVLLYSPGSHANALDAGP